MKYKVKQSIQSNLENDLNEEYIKGYEWVCKLFAWNTECRGGVQKLTTYLLQRSKKLKTIF